MLRREKRDVELTLPKKTETVIEVELTLTQKRWYRAVFERNRNFLMQGPSKKVPSLINVLMQLRKVCNHPFLVPGSREAVYEDHHAAETAAALLNTNATVSPTVAVAGTASGDSDRDSAASPSIATDTSTAISTDIAANPLNIAANSLRSPATLSSAALPSLPNLQITSHESNTTFQNNADDVKKEEKCDVPLTDTHSDTLTTENKNLDPESTVATSEVSPAIDDPALKDPLVYCSGKIVFLHKLLIKLKREKSKSLIFSQFTSTLDVIQEYLLDYGYAYEVQHCIVSCTLMQCCAEQYITV